MNSKSILFFLVLVLVSGCVETSEPYTAQKRLDEFFKNDMPESSLIPFLAEGGKEIVPLLIADMQKKDTPKRRYIIGTVGELMDERAMPALKSIVLDSSEKEYIRCDASKAIEQIKPKQLDIFLNEEGESLKKLIEQCEKY